MSSSSSTLVARTPASRELAREPLRLRLASADRGNCTGKVELGAAALEREQRKNVRRPGCGGRRDAGIDRIGCLDRGAQLVLELLEPRAREDPRPSPLDALRISVEDEPERVRAHGRMHRRRSISPFDARHSLVVAVARRSRVDHTSAAERRLRAQDHAIAARRDDRRGQAQLRVALAHPDDARGNVGRSDVNLDASAVANRLELVEHDVEPVRDRVAVALDERIAAKHLRALDSGQADRDPLSRLRPLDVAVVHLHAPYAHVLAGGLENELVAGADRARPERPGRHRADAAQRERAVDVQARPVRPTVPARRRPRRGRSQRAARRCRLRSAR